MRTGLSNLKHIVVLMMENRSFDHMLGSLAAKDRRINGLTGSESNPDTTNELVSVQASAKFQGQLTPCPSNRFPAVHKQLFFGTKGPPCTPSMQGFVQSYFEQTGDVEHSHGVMHYFSPEKLPVLTSLARSFAIFNGWFSSVPGPTICNHNFAHFGTSFGEVGTDLSNTRKAYSSVYERMLGAGRTTRIYYYDQASSTMGVVNLLSNRPQIFATYHQFVADCHSGTLPDYSFIQPNYTDHQDQGGGQMWASDQHPDHNVQSGEVFIAMVYNAIRQNPSLWQSTVLLVVYDEHGGIYDHVPPPACTPDGFTASAQKTGTGAPFAFDRLGVRVPAVLVSPWIPAATVVAGAEDAVQGRVFEHASIPATVTRHFIGDYGNRSPREKAAQTFEDLLSDQMRPDWDCLVFNI